MDGNGWRAALAGYLPSVGEQAPPAEDPGNDGTPLALQFELRELVPRSTHRWNGPVSRAAKASAGELRRDHRLGVRPVAQTSRGWARSGLTWTNIPHLVNRLHLRRDQHRWFCEFGALHRALGVTTPGRDPDWVFLDEFANPVLWTLFDQAAALGIQLVGAGSGSAVRLRSQATLLLDLILDPSLDLSLAAGLERSVGRLGNPGPDGAHLVLAPLLSVDGAVANAAHARAIGDHGIYLVDPGVPRQIAIAPTGRLSAEQLSILATGRGRIAVPEDDAAEFLHDYLPQLRELIDISSSDSSVRLPPPAPPVLVAVVSFHPRHTIALAWRWHGGHGAGPPPALDQLLPAGLLPADWLVGGPPAERDSAEAPMTDKTTPNNVLPHVPPDNVPPDNVLPHVLPDTVLRRIPPPVTLRGIEAAEFAAKTLPLLGRLPGLRVESHGTAPDYRELTGTPRLTVTTVPSEKHDWFDLGVTVTVDGRTIPFVPLFKALAKGRRRLLLVDGSYLSLTHPAFKALAELIDESRDLDEWEPVPSLSRHQMDLWSDFEDLADEAVPALEWRALLAETRNDSPRPVELPRGLHAELRPYQREGLFWLAFLWRHRLGGILADDMGLGKTVQCLSLIQHVAESKNYGPRPPFLIVAPTSVMANWVSECRRFTPQLVVRQISATEGASGRLVTDVARGVDVVVTSYALLRLDFDAFQAAARSTGWAALVLDEAQFVKNPGSKVHAAALDLDVSFKLALTGTPLENSLTDLQAIFAIVAPGLFASAPRFFNNYVRPIEQSRPGITRGVGAGDAPTVNAAVRSERLARLRRRIRPFLLRRTKELVTPEWPAKQEQTLRVELAPQHRDLYELFLQRERQKLFHLLEDLDRNKFTVFRSLTLLRLLALDASLIGDEHADLPSSKLDVLLEQLDDVLAEGHRALVFSQFTSYLAKVGRRLDAGDIRYVYLDGRTRNRSSVVDEFKTGDAPVFLISLKGGGFGLNLTEADYVFLLDPWWNPASEVQAIDRTHRIGQHRSVMVYRLVATDTIEEKVLALQERKARLFDGVFDGQEMFSAALSADDIRELLA